MAKTIDNSIDQRVVKALGHPLRQRLLVALNEKVASPSELSEELGEPLGNVSYHTRILLDLGAIELVKTTPVRGAVEHHYRAVIRPFFKDEDWSRLPLSARRSIFGDILQSIWQDLGEAAASGGLDDERVHVSRTPLTLDEKGQKDMAALLTKTLDRALEIQAESAGRRVDGNAEGVVTQLAIMHFVRVGERPAAPKKSRGGGTRRKKSAKS
jgi:DNA-binding transcriptional ArsR family regulator